MSSAAKVIKYFGIAFAFLLIFNIFLGIWTLGNVLFTSVSNKEENENIEITEPLDAASKLNVSLKASSLEIKLGDKLSVENTNEDVKVKQEGNKLVIKEKKFKLFSVASKGKVVITVPQDLTFDYASITTGAGKVQIEDLMTKDLNLELGAGSLEIDNISSTGKAIVEGGAGKINIKNASFNVLYFEVGVGSCSMNAEFNGKTSIEAGVGKLEVNVFGDKEDYTLDIEHGIGEIKVDNEKVSHDLKTGNGDKKLSIEGGVGSINIRFLNR